MGPVSDPNLPGIGSEPLEVGGLIPSPPLRQRDADPEEGQLATNLEELGPGDGARPLKYG